MEMISKLSGHWLEIGAAVYLLGMVLYGHYKGFIRMTVSAASLLIALVCVNVAMPYVTDWLKDDTPVYETMKGKITESIGVDEILSDLGLTENTKKADERMIIEELPIPEQLKNLLDENNNTEVYDLMGVKYFQDYVGGYLADTILKAAAFAALFLLAYLALKIVVTWLDLIAKLPIVSGMNKLAGAALGGAEAMIFIWILCIVLTAFSRTGIGTAVFAQIDASPWLSWIYDHNMLADLALGLIRSVW